MRISFAVPIALVLALPGLASATPSYRAVTGETLHFIRPCSGSPGGTSSSNFDANFDERRTP